ncbi:MAG: replicative DNA helicase [Bacilli bacterium]|nr:replicative DNA helicase [Bacilli bacterium]
MQEKKIPHNIEAEQSVIGAMFLSKYALQKAVEELDKELFYLDSHIKIFGVISELADKKIPVDITTVSAELDRRDLLKQVGGNEYLSELVNVVPTAANIEEYIKIVYETATLRRLIEKATEIVSSCYKQDDDVTTILDNAEKNISSVVKTQKGTEFRSIQDVLFKTQQNLERLSESHGEITGLPSGFYDLDKRTLGFHENELIILAARPGMGKTSFVLNIATNAAINTKKTVAIFNMEMGAEQLALRMLSSVGQIENNKLKSGRLEHDDWKKLNEAISRLADSKIFIDDSAGITVNEIRSKCRRLSTSESGLALVVIDYLQLISGSTRNNSNRQQEVSDISRGLKTMAMELGVPVIAAAQLSRSVESREDKRPLLSDLRESGSIEQDADIVSFLFNEAYYKKEAAIDENTVKSELIIAKHRNGSTGVVDLIFKKNTSTFVNFVNKE